MTTPAMVARRERFNSRTRERFNPSRQFQTVQVILLNGQQIPAGVAFPKELVNPRLLRQLYEGRKLSMVPMGEAAPVAPEPQASVPAADVLMEPSSPPDPEPEVREPPAPEEEPTSPMDQPPVDEPASEEPLRAQQEPTIKQRQRVRI